MDKQISRVTRTKSEARANYNRLSRWYDRIAGRSEAKFRLMGVEMLDIQKEERVLEIGIGTGHGLVSFGEAVGENGWVAGIDLADEMALISLQRIIKAGLESRTAVCLSDGVVLPFSDDSFNAVFMSFLLELFDTPEIELVLDQCRRVLRSSGRVVNVSLLKTVDPGFAERIYEWSHARMPVLIDCRPINTQSALLSAGFKIIGRKITKMWGLPVEVVSATVIKD